MLLRRPSSLRSLAIVLLCAACEAPAAGTDAGATPVDAPRDAAVLEPVTVETASGPVVGSTDPGGLSVFRGIPFAAPPVGALRFAPPAPAEPWTEPLDARGPGTVCYQSEFLTSRIVGEEDCLHLNVWTPSLDGARPVMVWIHGGGFVSGSGTDELADATNLAREGDMVVVSINYRLGVFGFLAHPSLAGDGEPNGNWGVLDQQAAIRWVQENATAFGGDPTNVTVFGHSAGGMSTCLAALSPTAPAARQYVDQSGPCVITLHEPARAFALGEEIATAVSCTGDVASCLRSADREALLAALSLPELPGGALYQEVSFPFRPMLDGVTFVEQPMAALRAGHLADAHYVFGAARDEGTMFHHSLAATSVADAAQMRAALERLPSIVPVSAAQIDAIVAAYPVAAHESANAALQAATTDMFICAMRYLTRLTTAAGRTSYLYHFAQEPARVGLPDLGVYHGADLVFLFGNRSSIGGNPSSAPELGPAMRARWSAFAETGAPTGTPEWPVWTATADQRLHLAETIAVEAGDAEARCALWDGVLDTL